jgi:cell division septation protein DedD
MCSSAYARTDRPSRRVQREIGWASHGTRRAGLTPQNARETRPNATHADKTPPPKPPKSEFFAEVPKPTGAYWVRVHGALASDMKIVEITL